MSTEDLMWGLMMMVVGMGVVFLLLALLMGLLMAIGAIDSPKRPKAVAASDPTPEIAPVADVAEDGEAAAPSEPAVRIIADGLDENQVAAITVAVMTHHDHRRRLAAPETRAFAPGSQLFASRWISIGRGAQNNPFTRR